MIEDFRGKTAVITGAGSGFGLEASRIAAARGHERRDGRRAAGRARRAPRPRSERSARRCWRSGSTCRARPRSRRSAPTVQQRFGAPHFVFNNAGVGAGGLIWETLAEGLGVGDRRQPDGRGAWRARLHADDAGGGPGRPGLSRPHRQHRQSMAGLLNAPNMGVYNVSKHAVVSLSETLYQDLRAGDRPDRRLGAVPVLRADRHQPEPPQPAGRHGRRRSRPEPADRAGDERQGGRQRQGHRRRQSRSACSTRCVPASSTSTATRRRWPACSCAWKTRCCSRNPTDPFAAKPEIGQKLREALRSAS